MKYIMLALLLVGTVFAQEQKTPATLRSNLLDQLQTTHNKKDWFVDGDTAVAGLTPEQANWTDAKGNHSVGQLLYHLVFWNRRSLEKFKGEPQEKFDGNNDETFTGFNPKQWTATVQAFDDVMSQWEQAVQSADEQKLEQWAPTIARIGTHNAYHIGEIVFMRKEQGSWNPEKGVK